SDLTLDPTFGVGGKRITAFPGQAADPSQAAENNLGYGLLQQSNGDIVLVGSINMGTGVPPNSVGVAFYLPTNLKGDDGTVFKLPGIWTDPGLNDGPWNATVDYGDGSGSFPLVLNLNQPFNLDHNYTTPGTFTVTITITDKDGGSTTLTENV